MFAEGDFTGDGVFDQTDIVATLQAGHYLQGPYTLMRESDDVAPSLSKRSDTDAEIVDVVFLDYV